MCSIKIIYTLILWEYITQILVAGVEDYYPTYNLQYLPTVQNHLHSRLEMKKIRFPNT